MPLSEFGLAPVSWSVYEALYIPGSLLTPLFVQDFVKILTDPTPAELGTKIHVGEVVTWPKVRQLFLFIKIHPDERTRSTSLRIASA